MSKRFVETYVMPMLWLGIVGMMLWGCLAMVPSAEEAELLEAAARSDFGRTSRTDHATTPAWQPLSVVDGACSDIVPPNQ